MRYQSKKIRQVRLQIVLPETILAAVDDYRFATRAPNRAEAIRRLLKIGSMPRAPAGCPNPTSQGGLAYGPKRNAGPHSMPSLAAGLSVLRVSVVVGAYNGKKLILIGRVGTLGSPRSCSDGWSRG